MKKIIITTIATIIMALPVMAANEVTVYSNDNLVADKGCIIENRTMVPVRGIFENFGYTVEWDNATKTATLSNDNIVIKMTNGEKSFTLNDKTITPDVPQQIVDGRFMLPLRSVGEAIGAEVEWDAATKTASITSDVKPSESPKDNIEANGDFSIPGVTITEIDPFNMGDIKTEIEF
jgi:copper amine oxidase domain protein